MTYQHFDTLGHRWPLAVQKYFLFVHLMTIDDHSQKFKDLVKVLNFSENGSIYLDECKTLKTRPSKFHVHQQILLVRK